MQAPRGLARKLVDLNDQKLNLNGKMLLVNWVSKHPKKTECPSKFQQKNKPTQMKSIHHKALLMTAAIGKFNKRHWFHTTFKMIVSN